MNATIAVFINNYKSQSVSEVHDFLQFTVCKCAMIYKMYLGLIWMMKSNKSNSRNQQLMVVVWKKKQTKKQCLLMNLCQRWISFVNEGSCKHDFDVQTYVKCSKLCNLLYLGFVMVRGEPLIPTCIDSFFRNNSFLSKLINSLNETNLSEQTFYFSLKPWKITNQFNFFQCWLKGFNKPRL